MKKIGEGYYYSVYELENDKVLKRIKSRVRIFFYILISQRFGYKFFPKYRKALTNISNMKPTYVRLLKNTADYSLLGNPSFIGDGINYQQDRVVTIRDFFKHLNVE